MFKEKVLLELMIKAAPILQKQIVQFDELLVLSRTRNELAKCKEMKPPVSDGTIKGYINSRELLVSELKEWEQWLEEQWLEGMDPQLREVGSKSGLSQEETLEAMDLGPCKEEVARTIHEGVMKIFGDEFEEISRADKNSPSNRRTRKRGK